MTVAQIQAAGVTINQLITIGQATIPRIKAVIALFSLTDEELNARLDAVIGGAADIKAQAAAELT